jgi:hypothetical protein
MNVVLSAVDSTSAERAHLDTTTGTPDLSGSNTRWLHNCRMDPAFRAGAISCMGDGVRVLLLLAGHKYRN